jgi:hypothetical protein
MITNAPPASLSSPKESGRAEWPWWALLFLIAVLLWCTAYNRWTVDAWKTPIAYNGDAWAAMGIAKTFAAGEVKPMLPKYPPSLGAPFVANWNDYPPAEGLFTWYGLLACLTGIFAGSNLVVLSAHLLAAGAFYFVARKLGYQSLLSMAGALLFSMSHFAFARNLAHLGPLFHWHVPLGLLVAFWCVTSISILPDRRKTLFSLIVAILHGIQDPYYSGIFLQFLVLASVACLVRRQSWRHILFPVWIALAVLGTHVLVNFDLFYGKFINGPNPEAFVRSYAGLELYSLKPLELLLPFPHRIPGLDDWASKVYFNRAYFLGEIGSAYLGILGIVGLGLLLWLSFYAIVSRREHDIPVHSWGILWILLYSVAGGMNGFVGLFGVILFRGTNRYSIVILAILLLFLVRQLSISSRRWKQLPIAALAGLIVVIGFLDQTPRPPTRAAISRIGALISSDGQVVSALEAKLPARAMIFELPVMGFPEMPAVREMMDYEHFRPYLQSHSLRFSYGTVKGRTRERWQAEAVRLGTPHLVNTLERYGFSAILINKKAYEAKAAALLGELTAAGRSEIICESQDLVGLRLQPVPNPYLPPEFDRNWSDVEGTASDNWRWSTGDASVIFYNQSQQPREMRVSFLVSSLRSGTIQVFHGGQELFSDSLSGQAVTRAARLTVTVPPGACELRFHTNIAGAPPGNGDTRKLAFNVRNFTIED